MSYNKISTSEWVIKANKIHKNEYSYLLTEYTGAKNKIKIICKIHGEFEQTANNHLQGQKCPKCQNEYRSNNTKSSLVDFINKVESVSPLQFDFSDTVYINSRTKVKVKCKVCNSIEEKSPKALVSGVSCMNCTNLSKTLTKEEFINKAIIKHNENYDYSNVSYVNNRTPVSIYCKKCNTNFMQHPCNHLIGQGCPTCAISGFDKNKPAILYYLSINNGQAYKIGITNRTVNERFNITEIKNIQVLKIWEYSLGKEAYDKEQEILKKYSKFKYTGPSLLDSGNTELFKENVLEHYLIGSSLNFDK